MFSLVILLNPEYCIMKYLKYLIIPLALMGCIHDPDDGYNAVGEVEGYVPIYAESLDGEIVAMESHPLKDPGKIYIYGTYLFVNEYTKGIHIIDNSNPSNPQYAGFLSIPGNVDMAVRGTYLYADHRGDLVTLDISDLKKPKETSREKGRYAYYFEMPPEGGYFECVDKARISLLIGWEKKVIMNPQCFSYEN